MIDYYYYCTLGTEDRNEDDTSTKMEERRSASVGSEGKERLMLTPPVPDYMTRVRWIARLQDATRGRGRGRSPSEL